MLLDRGANVKAIDCVAQSPLHIASARESKLVLSTLLAAAADVNPISFVHAVISRRDDQPSMLDTDHHRKGFSVRL